LDDHIISLRHIGKSFSGVQVLKDINLDLRKGEIHALVGENGAGKSTLVKILMGVYDRSEGEIVIDGQTMKEYGINTARKHGVNMIPQELALVPALSVGENILLGQKKGKYGFISLHRINREADRYIKELGFHLDPKERVDRLPLSYRQLVSITKSVAEQAQLIIMDEPTSSLSRDEVEDLKKIIFKLKERGTTVIYISHLLDEVFAVSDRITVLRDGKLITTLNREETNQRELISYMVGEDLLRTQETLREDLVKQYHEKTDGVQKPVLSVRNVKRKGAEPRVSFDLFSGEIVGVTGLVGAGKTELIKTILGLEKMESGELLLEEKPIVINSPQDAYRHGIATVPEDRKLEGLALIRSNMENMSMSDVYRKNISRYGFIDKKKERENALSYVGRLTIRLASLNQRVVKLSGGNQQKIVITKALLSRPKILIMDEPTRGIDIGAKTTIYKLIHELKEQGVAVLYFSSDVSEMSFVGDRVLIMREGDIVKELPAAQATVENMLNYMAGGKDNE